MNQQQQSKNKTFKPNIAIDMVSAALQHYKKHERPVDFITLNHRMWNIWVSGILERDPTLEIQDEMHFKDCKVRKGSIFMLKSMTVELKKRVLA